MPEVKETEEILSALDPDLPLLASQAAIELDNFIRSKGTEFSATKRLALLLSRSFETMQGLPAHSSLADPATVSLVSRAFHIAQWAGPVRTVNELASEAWKVATKLENTSIEADPGSLKGVRAFCAALAECSASYLQSRYSHFPAHPYRR